MASTTRALSDLRRFFEISGREAEGGIVTRFSFRPKPGTDFAKFLSHQSRNRPRDITHLLPQDMSFVYGGDIAVESELGAGSRFTVSLPAHYASPDTERENVEQTPPSTFEQAQT